MVLLRPVAATVLALAGGALLIVAGVEGGLGLLGFLLEFLAQLTPAPYHLIIYYTLVILSFLASLGGATVMIGAYCVYVGRYSLGKFLMSIGSGTGVLGFLASIIPRILQGPEALAAFLMTMGSSASWIGTSLSVLAIVLTKRQKAAQKVKREVDEEAIRRFLRP